jgi:glycine cleavage system aminomethyltransferase T/glycine/D-amino acid oxidase-like deaminating enzyme
MHDTQAELVIVGAGIVGCSVAAALAARGWRDIVVLDQGPLFETGGSTSHAPGLVFQTNSSQTMCALAQASVAAYLALSEKSEAAGHNAAVQLPCFYPVGSLEVATTRERWADLARRRGYAASWGLQGELLSPREAQELLPLLDSGHLYGAYYVPGDGIAKAVRAAESFGRQAQAQGVRFYGTVEVTGIEQRKGRVSAVLTDQGRIATERVLVCAGIWGPRITRMVGLHLPLTPVQHQYARTTPLAELAGEAREIVHPILRHQDGRLYARQHADYYGVGSYAHEPILTAPDAIRRHADSPTMPSVMPFTPEHFAEPWQEMQRLLPALGRVDVATAINGLFSFTPDGMPLIGEAATLRGFWVAEAVWVTQGAGVGAQVAEWLSEGAPSIDLRECDLKRFDAFAHSPSYIRARGAQQYREVYDIIHPLQQMEQPRPLRTSPFYPRQQALGAVFFEGRGWERAQWFAGQEPRIENQEPGAARTEQRAQSGAREQAGERSNQTNKNAAPSARSAVPMPGPQRIGWAAQYWSPRIAEEHLATRDRVALFDMTPLARCEIAGIGALALLQSLTTNQLDRPVGSVTYTAMVNDRGGLLSDITVTRLGEEHFWVAHNGPSDLAYFQLNTTDERVHVRDVTGGTCCIGLWGPHARDLLQPLCDDDLSNAAFPYFTARRIFVAEVPVLALRVSFVGERGWELYTSAEYGLRLWDLLWQAGQPHGIIAAGRGAFDSLRVEKGYRFYGVDMHSEYDPYEAGIGFTVKLSKGDFRGRGALAERKKQGLQRKLCCLTLVDSANLVLGKEPIYVDGRVVGYVTSANAGYSVGQSIAYGYLPIAQAELGTAVEIEYFGERFVAIVAADPLFDPKGERLRV